MSTLTMQGPRAARANRVTQLALAAAAYATFTVSTAKYPTDIAQLVGNVSAAVLYTSIGFANEVGEVAEQFDSDAMRDDSSRKERYAKAWKELGDVQWYIARLCAEMPELPSFESMVERAMQLVVDDPRELRVSGFDLQSALCAYSGRVLGVVKKMMRDGAEWSPEKRAEKIAEMRNFLQLSVNISVEFAERTGPLVECSGGYAALLNDNHDNHDKLQDRKDRGVLKGDGDAR